MYKKLKWFRVVFAVFMFVFILCSFLHISAGYPAFHLLLHTQFVPALISVFTGSALACILLIILTLLFGRVYCSFLCPLGILQDLIIRISRFFCKKRNKGRLPKSATGYKKPHTILRYSILGVVFILFAAGITYPLALLDPYSAFGRIASDLFSNGELWLTNSITKMFPGLFYYQPFVKISYYSFLYALLFFIVITVFSAFRGRLYCNIICPVGSLLGLLSGFSLFKPVIQKSMCVKCRACAIACKSNCINLETKEIDVTRCVACYDCMIACKRGGIKLVPTWRKEKNTATLPDEKTQGEQPSPNPLQSDRERTCESKERRNALIAMGALGSALIARGLVSKGLPQKFADQIDKTKIKGIVPPGGENITHLKSFCTACHACVAACPNNIIIPATTEYGLDGFMLPTISYKEKYCAYDCNKCSQACPQGALKHLSLEEKQKTKIAQAHFAAKNCLVFKNNINCGACSRICPVGAIEMMPLKGKEGLYFPKLNPKKCIGCGACQYACPPTPKAMTVKALS